MHNVKVRIFEILNEILAAGYECYFIGNYPFVKSHNSTHQNKMKIKQFSLITTAPLSYLQEHYKISKVCTDDYNNHALIEEEIKSNLYYFPVYYPSDYINVVTGKSTFINTIADIQNEFSFLLDTILIDKNQNIINYKTATESLQTDTIVINGNIEEKIKTNPLLILDLFTRACNINYSINKEDLKVIQKNYQYLQYCKLSTIIKYMNLIIGSKNPMIGLKLIINNMIDFEYKGTKIFKFLSKVPEEMLNRFCNMTSSLDLISRWTLLLKDFSKEEYTKIISNFHLKTKNKIIWLIEHFNCVHEDDYKMSIYNSRDSLKTITECQYGVFLLFDMFEHLTKMNIFLNSDFAQKAELILNAIYGRPFFDYQLMYDDNELCKIVNKENGDWLKEAKENLLKDIINCDFHPTTEQYLELVKKNL